ncbi:MAG: helix-turn-helix domain-containing protein [Phycisphaerales bacterium]|nr:helix-turn-helix domain-containing protein [Phycisphaerales bacterium]
MSTLKSQASPSLRDWHIAVADSDLGKCEKAVLWVLIRYIKWGKQYPTCYPSIQTLAKKSDWCERSVQGALKKLESLKIVHVTEGPAGRKTLTRSLSWPALIARTPAEAAGVQSKTPARSAGVAGDAPRTPCALPLQPLPGTPARRAPHPRRACTQSYHQPSIEPANEQEGSAQVTDGMACEHPEATRKRQVYRALKMKGVQGKNLSRLAASEQITVVLIEREWQRIAAAPDIRNATAVLVQALAELAGIKLGSQQALAGMNPIEARLIRDTQARIDQRRRDLKLEAS